MTVSVCGRSVNGHRRCGLRKWGRIPATISLNGPNVRLRAQAEPAPTAGMGAQSRHRRFVLIAGWGIGSSGLAGDDSDAFIFAISSGNDAAGVGLLATRIWPEYGERWFCSEDEARRADWRKSKM